MRPPGLSTALTAILLFAASTAATCLPCDAAQAPEPTLPSKEAPHIAWFAGDVDAAFARARQERKPLFLYWGASWCPPCIQVKASLFKRLDFIERSAQFVPVYIDGDQPKAQTLGERFRVAGYPTMILFTPDGAEITRLPGEIDPAQYLQALSLGLGTGRSARATLRTALGDARAAATVRLEDWTLLADYSWDTDEGQLVAADRVASTLIALAKACPVRFRAASDRLVLRSITAALASREKTGLDQEQALSRVREVLADSSRARALFDLLVEWAPEITGLLTEPDSAARQQLVASWDARLAAFATDAGLAGADRLDALAARVALVRLGNPNASPAPALVAAIRSEVARADRETTDPFERQAVVSSAAQLLALASLESDSDRLLQAELPRSPAPYYLMLELAANARKRGDDAAAIDWYRQAYAGAQGPATRLQWGARYVSALTELAPAREDLVSQAVAAFFDQLEPAAATFDGRNRRALEKLSAALLAWNAGHAHDEALNGARAKIESVCRRLPADLPQRANCIALLRQGASAG